MRPLSTVVVSSALEILFVLYCTVLYCIVLYCAVILSTVVLQLTAVGLVVVATGTVFMVLRAYIH